VVSRTSPANALCASARDGTATSTPSAITAATIHFAFMASPFSNRWILPVFRPAQDRLRFRRSRNPLSWQSVGLPRGVALRFPLLRHLLTRQPASVQVHLGDLSGVGDVVERVGSEDDEVRALAD